MLLHLIPGFLILYTIYILFFYIGIYLFKNLFRIIFRRKFFRRMIDWLNNRHFFY